MPVHIHADVYHTPGATEVERRTARCGLVLDADGRGRGRNILWTGSEFSRREDVASWDESGHELRLLYSRACADCLPYTRDPDVVKGLLEQG